MKLEVLNIDFSVCRVSDYSGVDIDAKFTFTGSTDDERSLVCPTERVPHITVCREDGWRAFRIVGVLDFSLIGILSRITGILAENGIGVFAVSTYNTDYIFVKKENFRRAVNALEINGYDIIV